MDAGVACPSPPRFGAERRGEGESGRGRCGRGLTLGERLECSWRAAGAGEAAECPVCRGQMVHEGSFAGCRDCGSALS